MCQAQEVGWDSILDSMNIWRFGSFDIFHFNLRCQLEKRNFPKHPWVAIINYTENQYKSKDFANRFLVATKHWKLPAVHICPRFAPRAVTLPGSCMREGGNTSTASPPASTKSATVFPKPGCKHDETLLLPGEMNILQIQCKIDFNTFLLPKPHSRCKKWLINMLVVHVGCLLGVPGHQWWYLALIGTIWWLLTNFDVLFTTLSLNNAIFLVIFCYL